MAKKKKCSNCGTTWKKCWKSIGVCCNACCHFHK